jgi:5-methylcytosine-specific restriction endonuclease McrA
MCHSRVMALPPRVNAKQRTLLAIIATDATFERASAGDREVWSGKCLHCNARLMIGLDGEPISRATIEHIIPQSHGGTDDLANLGIACARCNSEKGIRHDNKRTGDARLAEVVAKLEEKRKARWRAPPT